MYSSNWKDLFDKYIKQHTSTSRCSSCIHCKVCGDASDYFDADGCIHYRRMNDYIRVTELMREDLEITDVIFNPPATIVFWNDGTKTVVKCGEFDTFDPEKGLAMAICKRTAGNKGNYFNEFKKWVERYYEKIEEPTSTLVDDILGTINAYATLKTCKQVTVYDKK